MAQGHSPEFDNYNERTLIPAKVTETLSTNALDKDSSKKQTAYKLVRQDLTDRRETVMLRFHACVCNY